MSELNVNTIEFGGRKAVLNSYSDHPALVADINRQREAWARRFPRATVRTERMSELECMELVAANGGPDRYRVAYAIGAASLEGEAA
ncbi:MAG: hypothetical protein NW206_20015 [Hyphomonadaceae bacterium]|nr:hypothetical protein [Hyphomonadaceae bacterium]